jgi:hypothetical protein
MGRVDPTPPAPAEAPRGHGLWVTLEGRHVLPRALAGFSFLLWPIVLGSALVSLGLSSNATLSLISEAAHSTTSQSAQTFSYRARKMAMGPTVAIRVTAPIPNTPKSTSTAPAVQSPSQPLRMVAIRNLILRSKPMATSAVVVGISKGDRVVVRSRQGRWWLVTTSEDNEGWLFASYLAPQKG